MPGGQRGRGEISRPISWPHDSRSLPASDFARLMELDDKALFEGLRTQDGDDSDGRNYAEQNLTAEEVPVPESSDTIDSGDQHPAGHVADQRVAETGRLEIRRLVEHLMELSIVSPTFADTFLVNQDQVAYLLAKQAFLSMAQLADQKHPLRSGTHQSGTRGRQTLQLDRTRRTRQVSFRLAIGQTLRRGMARRVLFPLSGLIDEEDLIEFASRKKVGYSIVIALDISGAVQFGRRIQGVRKACMAFSYYLRRFHPRDRVRYVAYHEVPREIRFSSVPRLRAVNGLGKDIGACLKKCRELLLHDPERVPAIVLIGDGLPAHGERAGFYRFMENNRDLIDNACAQARLLRREEILLTFLQFREDRHLWQEYADETAMNIAREARGTLYRIDSADDIVSSLMGSYARFNRLSKNAHLLRCTHYSSLRRTTSTPHSS
jgi:Mg-chelatase subunit ChlD